jgi:hypothetical protein
MLNIYATKQSQPEQETSEGIVVHPVEYTLLAKDTAGNKLEIGTNKETYAEVTTFLDALKNV